MLAPGNDLAMAAVFPADPFGRMAVIKLLYNVVIQHNMARKRNNELKPQRTQRAQRKESTDELLRELCVL